MDYVKKTFLSVAAPMDSGLPIPVLDRPKKPSEIPNPDSVPELPQPLLPSPDEPSEIPDPDLIPEIPE